MRFAKAANRPRFVGCKSRRPGADNGLKQDGEIAGARHALVAGRGEMRNAEPNPALDGRAQSAGQFAQHGEPSAHILAAFVIVRRGRQHRVRKIAAARLHAAVEFGGGAAEAGGDRNRRRCAK